MPFIYLPQSSSSEIGRRSEALLYFLSSADLVDVPWLGSVAALLSVASSADGLTRGGTMSKR